MNMLSWLIYLAGVTGSLGNFLVFVAVVFGILAGVTVVVWLWSLDESDSRYCTLSAHDLESKRKVRPSAWRWSWGFLILMIMFGSTSALMPSRQTVLLIAASQMGEQVLNHPRVNEVVNPGIELLTTWMQKETADLRRAQEPSTSRR